MKRKSMAVFLVVVFVVSFAVDCHATTISRENNGIKYVHLALYDNAFQIFGGKAHYSGTAITIEKIDVEITAKLQRKVNNKWTTVYTKSDKDIREATINIERYIVKGYTYRVLSICYYYDGNTALEEDNWTSKEIYY